MLASLRTGEISIASERARARHAADPADPYAAAAMLAVLEVDGDEAAFDADAAFARASEAADAAALAAAPYALRLHRDARAAEARETADRGLARAATLDELHGLAIAAASFGDAALDARIFAALESCIDHRTDALEATKAHARALAAAARGETAASREAAARAQTHYARAGWHYCAALADELAGNAATASRAFRRFGARRDDAPRGAAAEGAPDPLSAREREIARAAARGGSNAAIADLMHISEKTVEKHLSAAYRKLGVANRVELAAALNEPRRAPQTRIPAPIAPFVGRVDDLDRIGASLRDYRLVTIAGAGGSGKTRAAIEYARDRAEAGDRDVWFVDLSGVHDARGIAPSIAAAVVPDEARADARATLDARLASRDALLVLDNCEHLVPKVGPIVRDLLDRAPLLRILATSRQRLGVLGECVIRFGPMAPADAVALFVDRARGAGIEVAADDDAARICERVDRIPLAIELAAARLHDLTLAQLESALDGSPSALRTEDASVAHRHRSIDALIEWGYDALDDRGRELCRAFSVFSGAFSAERAVAAFGPESGAALAALHRFSLVERLADGRYRMLQVVRDVALALLRAEGEERDAFQRYAAAYRDLLRRAHDAWFDTPIEAWLAPLRDETANVENALAWCFSAEGDRATGVALAAYAARLWNELGRESELEPYLLAAIEAETCAEDRDRALLWLARARFLDIGGDYEGSLAAARRALPLASERDDPRGYALAILAVGCSWAAMGNAAEANPVLESALAKAEAHGMKRAVATALMAMAMGAESPAAAAVFFSRALEIARDLENALLEAIALVNLGEAYGMQGDDARALDFTRRGLAHLERIGAQTRLIRARVTLAAREEAAGEHAAALRTAARAMLDVLRRGDPRLGAKAAEIVARALPADDGTVRRLDAFVRGEAGADDIERLTRELRRLLE